MKVEAIKSFFTNKLIIYILFTIAFVMPITKKYIPLLMSLWVIISIISFKKVKLNNFKTDWFLVFPFIIYAYLVIGSIYSENINEALFDLEVKLTILFIPLIVISISKNININYNLILKLFVLGCFFASLFCLFFAFYDSFSLNESGKVVFEHSVWGGVTKDMNFVEIINKGYSKLSYTFLSRIHHPAYFSMFILFSIIFLVHKLKKAKRKYLNFSLIIYFIFFLWLLGSRAAYLTFFIVFFIFSIINIIRNKRKWIFLGLLCLVTISSFVILLNSRLGESIKESVSIVKGETPISKDIDIRFWLWKAGVEVFKENLLIGVGTGDINDELNKKYIQFDLIEAQKNKLNVHNQYLDVAIKLGLPGLILFISWFVFIIIKTVKRKQYLFFFFTVILIINFFFEVIFNSIAGVAFFVFFYSLLTSKYKRDVIEH